MSYRIILKLAILSFLVCIGKNSTGQLYADLYSQKDFYNFNEPLTIEASKNLIVPRIGVIVYNSDNDHFKIAIETGVFLRRFNQDFEDADYTYKFSGILISPVASYEFLPKLFLDLGVGWVNCSKKLESESKKLEIGEGFRNFDIAAIGGVSYYPLEWLAVGIRYSKYFRKMLEFRLIDDYGNFRSSQKDITSQRIEFYVRIQVGNNWYQ